MTAAAEQLLPLVYTGGPLATNAYLIPDAIQAAYLCIDAPKGLAAELRESGIQVDALLLTHGHSDHVADAEIIVREHQCPVYVHAADEPPLPGRVVRHLPVPDGTGELNVGGRHFVLFHIPGHSPGSVAFYEPEHHRIFGGDLVFAGGIGRCKSEALRLQLLGGIAHWILPLPDSTEIYPGHGAPTLLGTERREPYFRHPLL